MKPSLSEGEDARRAFASLDDLLVAVNEELPGDEAIDRSTVHFYRARDLISAPGRGRAVRWTTRHVEEIRTVRKLQREGLTLRRIREMLARANNSSPAVKGRVPAGSPPPTPAPQAISLTRSGAVGEKAGRFSAAAAELVVLGPGVELVVRRPLGPREEWALAHLLDEAERIF